jgi:putative oxygen-independent coproporphyrinogen III oxidase
MLELPPLSLYVHIPWCIKKCPYCDFNSHQGHENIPEQAYLQALLKDLNNDLHWVKNRKLHSIFFGGGTPSLFSAQSIEKIISAAEKHIGFEANKEITLEANPGSAEQQKFADFYSAGVNRLSIGVQSFNDQHLKSLGRIHNAEHAKKAIEMAQKSGFERFNIDLMHGLPYQSREDAMADLDIAIQTGAAHISWYQLTIEPNTSFFSRPPILPEEDQLADIQDLGMHKLSNAGFSQYEVSAFGKAGEACRHNLNYWQFGDYLGIGAGAHGKLTMPEKAEIVRTAKTRQPEHFMSREKTAIATQKPINPDQLSLEFMMNALRLTQGVNKELYAQRTGLNPSTIAELISQLEEDGLLSSQAANYCTTDRGMRYLDSVLQRFS